MFELDEQEGVLVVGLQIETDIEVVFFCLEGAPALLQLVVQHMYVFK